MATIRKIKNPSGKQWEVRFRDPRVGTQKRRRFATRELAEVAFDEARRIEGLDPAAPIDRDITVEELIALEAASSHRTDQKTNASYVRNHVPDWMLRQKARYVTIEDIETVLNEAGQTICRESVNKLRWILSGVFKYGHQRRYCDRNPVTGSRLPTDCAPSSRARKRVDDEIDPDEIPSPKEAKAIVAAIGDRFKVLVLAFCLLGLRMGEACALNVSHWNPETRLLRVTSSGQDDNGTKGHLEMRYVDVPRSLARKLDEHMAKYCKGPNDPLFPGPLGGRLTGSNVRERYFYPAVDIALGQVGKDEENRRRIRPHDLRHTAATMMIVRGTPDVEIAKQLGHSDSSFTRRIYAGVWRRHERVVSELIDADAAEMIGDEGGSDEPADDAERSCDRCSGSQLVA